MFSKKEEDFEHKRFDNLLDAFKGNQSYKVFKETAKSFAAGFTFEAILPLLGKITGSNVINTYFTADGLGSLVSKAVVAKFPATAKAAALTIPKAIPLLEVPLSLQQSRL